MMPLPTDRAVVTVVIPTYQQAEFLHRALRSLVDQTFRNWQAVIIDNFSTDHTTAVVAAFADSRLRLVQLRNNGVIGASRNLGISLAEAPWIAFLDSDDIWYPAKLTLSLAAGTADTDVVCHAERWVSPDRPVRTVYYGPESRATYEALLYNGNCLSTSAIVVRRDTLLSVGGFSEEPAFVTSEDYELWLRLAKAGARFRFLRDVLGDYQIHAAGNSQAVPRHVSASLAVLQRHFGDGARAGRRAVLRRRRATARVFYSGARLLQKQGMVASSMRLLARALASYPFEPRFYAAVGLGCMPRRCRVWLDR